MFCDAGLDMADCLSDIARLAAVGHFILKTIPLLSSLKKTLLEKVYISYILYFQLWTLYLTANKKVEF